MQTFFFIQNEDHKHKSSDVTFAKNTFVMHIYQAIDPSGHFILISRFPVCVNAQNLALFSLHEFWFQVIKCVCISVNAASHAHYSLLACILQMANIWHLNGHCVRLWTATLYSICHFCILNLYELFLCLSLYLQYRGSQRSAYCLSANVQWNFQQRSNTYSCEQICAVIAFFSSIVSYSKFWTSF